MLEKYRESHRIASKRWEANNRARRNAKRRERRAHLKALKMKGLKCLLCEVLMEYDSKGTRVYCRRCNLIHAKRVQNHKWARYYHSKLKFKRNATI